MIGKRRPRRERVRPWREAGLCVVDFETTDADPRRAEPLSVGWVPVDGGRVSLAGAGYTLIQRRGPLPAATVGVHGIIPSDVSSAPPVPDVAAALSRALDGRLLVAHGARLELAVLDRLGVAAHRRRTVDTLALARRLDAVEGRHSNARFTLGALAARHGVPMAGAHNAFGDALATAMVLLVLAARCERLGSGAIGDLLRLGRPS